MAGAWSVARRGGRSKQQLTTLLKMHLLHIQNFNPAKNPFKLTQEGPPRGRYKNSFPQPAPTAKPPTGTSMRPRPDMCQSAGRGGMHWGLEDRLLYFEAFANFEEI